MFYSTRNRIFLFFWRCPREASPTLDYTAMCRWVWVSVCLSVSSAHISFLLTKACLQSDHIVGFIFNYFLTCCVYDKIGIFSLLGILFISLLVCLSVCISQWLTGWLPNFHSFNMQFQCNFLVKVWKCKCQPKWQKERQVVHKHIIMKNKQTNKQTKQQQWPDWLDVLAFIVEISPSIGLWPNDRNKCSVKSIFHRWRAVLHRLTDWFIEAELLRLPDVRALSCTYNANDKNAQKGVHIVTNTWNKTKHKEIYDRTGNL